MIPSAFQMRRLKSSLEQSGVQITEQAKGLIDFAIEKGDTSSRVGFEAQLQTAKAIVDRGIVDPTDIVIEPDVKSGDVDLLVQYDGKTYHLQVGAKNFYDSDDFFPTTQDKVDEFYESIKESSHNRVYDILYECPKDIRAKVSQVPSAPGSAARIQFSPDFYGQKKIQAKIRDKLQKAAGQLRGKEGPLQFNVAVVGANSFLAAGDDTNYHLTLKELEENPRDYWNIDLVLIQSMTINTAKRSTGVRLLPLRNPHTLPDLDTHIFGETEGVQLYRIRYAVFPYHFSEPGEYSLGIREGRLHIDGHTGPKII